MRKLLCLIALTALPLRAQDASELLMNQAGGTSANPAAAHEHLMLMEGSWHLMLHGAAFLDDLRATGPRGGEKTFSTNWMMISAQRPLGGGHLLLRAMLSAEPATISGRKYPEPFQTGETAFGKQLIDGQHPHDLFMELAAEYARSLGAHALGYVYFAPVGDPALGPVGFPHRDSASEIPQAPLGHHYEDSTHISDDVVTAGVAWRVVRFEASAFHGAEPDEERWDLDGGWLDSESARLVITPVPSVSAQASFGYLTHPEKLEPGDQKRTTASISYTRGGWAASAIWGRVTKESHDNTVEAIALESTLRFLNRNAIAVRFEDAEKDELFPHTHPTGKIERPPLPVPTFRVKAATVGYTFDFLRRGALRVGAGGNYTWYRFPEILNGFYGERPRTRVVYVRARLGGTG
jgi:hypothetical protein